LIDKCFENMAEFKHLGTRVIHQNCIHEDMKSKLNLGNAGNYSVKNLLSYCLLSENVKVKIQRTIILPDVLYGCETWSLTMRKEHRLRVSDNRVMRRIFGGKREEVTGGWRRRNLYASPNIIRVINSRRMRWAGHVACTGGMRIIYKILVVK
jgi:hypothetical protein